MGGIKNKLESLEKRLLSMIAPDSEPVVFLFPNGEQMEFFNGHDALIFAIKNRGNKDVQGVIIETKKSGNPLLAKAILAGDPKTTKENEI